MTHPNRSRQKANERRRELAALKQAPVPLDEQQRRAEDRAQAHATRYPFAPDYGAKPTRRPKRERDPSADFEVPLFVRLAMVFLKRGMAKAARRGQSGRSGKSLHKAA